MILENYSLEMYYLNNFNYFNDRNVLIKHFHFYYQNHSRFKIQDEDFKLSGKRLWTLGMGNESPVILMVESKNRSNTKAKYTYYTKMALQGDKML